MNVWYLIPCGLLLIGCQVVRAVRFGAILRPFCQLNLKSLWDLVNIWNAANNTLPARLGELVRPYLLRQRGASFSRVFGAVLVERFFDLTGLLLLLGAVLWKSPNTPGKLSFLGGILLFCLILGYGLVLTLLLKREKALSFLRKMIFFLPHKVGTFVEKVFQKLIDGLTIMASARQAIIIFLYSVILWLFYSATTYLLLLGFSVEAPFFVAVTIQVFIALGLALPSAPGFVGTFHAAGRYALAMFGIGAVVSISFATVYHLFNLLLSLSLGIISYVSSDFRINQRDFLMRSDNSS